VTREVEFLSHDYANPKIGDVTREVEFLSNDYANPKTFKVCPDPNRQSRRF